MTPWYADDALWSGFAEVIFSADRAALAAEAVAKSPLFRFPAGARVLDQCCGPAVFTVPLAREGYAVTGMDLSPILLARAATACAEAGVDAELVRADVREFVRPCAFDAVVNLSTSFGYFDDPAENLRVLENARASLAPGGVLIVDVLGKELHARRAGQVRTHVVTGGTAYLTDTIHPGWTRYRGDWTLVRGDVASHMSLTLWAYSAEELRGLFHTAGLVDVECFGALTGTPYDDTAQRLVVRGVRDT